MCMYCIHLSTCEYIYIRLYTSIQSIHIHISVYLHIECKYVCMYMFVLDVFCIHVDIIQYTYAICSTCIHIYIYIHSCMHTKM